MIIEQKVTGRACKNVKVKWIIFLCASAKGCAWEIYNRKSNKFHIIIGFIERFIVRYWHFHTG